MSFEDRQDLFGHKSGRITTHYSAAELHKLIEAANKVCSNNKQGVVLTMLRCNNESLEENPHNFHTMSFEEQICTNG